MCLSTGGGRGVCLSACWDTPPRSRHPPWEQTPRTSHPPPKSRHHHPPDQAPPRVQTHPPPGSRLQHTVYERPVRILLECILVLSLKILFYSGVFFHSSRILLTLPPSDRYDYCCSVQPAILFYAAFATHPSLKKRDLLFEVSVFTWNSHLQVLHFTNLRQAPLKF